MKKYTLENKVLIKGKVFELNFDGCDVGDDYIKWHNFGTNYGEQKEFYILQICQEAKETDPYFSIALYSCDDGTDNYYAEWYDLDEYLENTESTIDKIKNYLIKKSDELISKNNTECDMKCNMCGGTLDYVNYKDTHIWICQNCPNIQFEYVEGKDDKNLCEFLEKH